MFVLGKTADSKQFSRQAMDLKRIIADFHPKEVVIDTNGLITSSFKTPLIAGKSKFFKNMIISSEDWEQYLNSQ